MATLNKSPFRDWLERSATNALQRMQTKADALLNPNRYHLSLAARQRLQWMYLLQHEHEGNVTRAAGKIGLSRQWLSTLHATFERYRRDPRSLEPESRAPHRTDNRRRIPAAVEDRIIAVRDATPGWGKEKIARILARDHGITVSKNTVNRYLHAHHRIDPKLSERNAQAWAKKLARERAGLAPTLRVKHRPPRQIKDYAPGALVEKDMKFVLKLGQNRRPGKEKLAAYFWYQHTETDSFTRLRTLELVDQSDSATAGRAHARSRQRFPFPIATTNTDNGSENGKEFAGMLQRENVFHFFSNVGTPTDNPRVERSHRTDEEEFYGRGNTYRTFDEQRAALQRWEYRYNHERPHQALGYLTPIEFYELWRKNPTAAHAIAAKYRAYLVGQRQRLAGARRIKRKDQIEKLMQFIDAKLTPKVDLTPYKLQLVNCQLCSWA